MSRSTAAQVIGLGEYLETDFDPTSLTVSQLLGVLGYHNIPYPTPYTKPKLVLVFNNEVKTRATKFKKERLRKENSIASEEGITDGITGQPLIKKGTDFEPLTRRSSRRFSQVPKEEDSSPIRPDPPKRRRSSAQPALGRVVKRVAQPQVALVEESEPEEEEEEELPLKKVGRTRKLTSAGQGRRVSLKSGGEDSGWEDNNIFQSGAESSSPARPSPVRPRVSRSSIAPRKTRKSTSAPPQMADSSPIRPSNLPAHISRSPPQSPFRPSLPPIPTYKFSLPPKARFTPVREFSPAEPRKVEPENEPHETDDTHPEFHVDDPFLEAPDIFGSKPNQEQSDASNIGHEVDSRDDSESQIDEAISRIMAEGLGDTSTLAASPPMHWFIRGVVWMFITASLFGVYNYKIESSSIGFCDRGSNTNQALENLIYKRADEEACRKKLLQLQNSTEHEQDISKFTCDLPPLIPLPLPSSCTPCPDHASCGQSDLICDSGYLLKPNIFLSFIPVIPSASSLTTAHVPQLSEIFFKAISVVTDGLPGFGSIGLPPRCVEDPQRKRHIGAMGKAIESRLAKERGKRVCRGDDLNNSEPQEDVEAAEKWGVEEYLLKEYYRAKVSPKMLPQFDDMFNTAIQQLTQWGGVFVGEKSDGRRWIAHKTPQMSLQCTINVKSRAAWAAWRTTVLASIISVFAVLAGRVWVTRKQKENRRIAGLVQVALDTLRNQELAHYTDPLTAPEPYLSSIQLRDLVLEDEHSVPTRRRLWERVESVVESNANVRVNLEEIEGGDETRVWRWVGSSGRSPGRKERELEFE